jgi:pyruvate formate lyase activating enzyme
MTGIIFDIKRFALHDGPGIRTTVFLRGCPLSCIWCHNPESQGFGIGEFMGTSGTCITVGREVSADEIVSEVLRDSVFYAGSGGGVTFSGGEPLAQPEFLAELLRLCGQHGLHRVVDTCGEADAAVLSDIAGMTDLFLYDIKLADSSLHHDYTGVGNQRIKSNLAMLCELGVEVQVRFPLIPGITDTQENLVGVAEILKSLPRRLDLKILPYHRASIDKYARFGMKATLLDVREAGEDEIIRCRRTFEGFGIVVI